MKLSKVAVAMVFGLAALGAHAAGQGQGQVHFEGQVVNAPCNISADTQDQTVKFGAMSSTLLNDGQEVAGDRDIAIKLENCDTSTLTKANVTFFGPNASTGAELGTSGTAQNVGIRIQGGDGVPVVLGTPIADVALQDGNNTLVFKAYAKKAASAAVGQDVTEGDFAATADFYMAYN